ARQVAVDADLVAPARERVPIGALDGARAGLELQHDELRRRRGERRVGAELALVEERALGARCEAERMVLADLPGELVGRRQTSPVRGGRLRDEHEEDDEGRESRDHDRYQSAST